MSDRKERQPESTPYGPHPHGIDESSGGADSSPFEELPSGEKLPAAEKEKASGRLEPRPAVDDDRSP
jgi:hypothetical protein